MDLTKNLDSWSDFCIEVDSLYEGQRKLRANGGRHSALLFRGQPDSSLALRTTLERWSGSETCLFRDYHLHVLSVVREIEARTGLQWDIPDYPEYERELSTDKPTYLIAGEPYNFLVYLRHHGFPSPLLDWSASPFIAAYFAFRSAAASSRVAIYAFQEYAGGGKGGWAAAPHIHGLGPHVRTHPRHFIQQSQYTVAYNGAGRERAYCPHERIFADRSRGNSDRLWKFTLPAEARKDALQYLQRHNVTAYSLFTSEEALM